MCFNFHHLKVDYKDGQKWEIKPPDMEAERQDEDSILNYYHKLIKLRKESALIGDGSIQFLYNSTHALLAFKRYNIEEELLVLNNLGSEEITLPEEIRIKDYTLLIGNYKDEKTDILKLLKPYESIVLNRRQMEAKANQ